MLFSPCEAVIERVSAVIDGEVSAVDHALFHAHLAICPPCRRYYKQLIQIRSLGAEPSADDLPDDFADVMGFVLDAIEPAQPAAPPKA